LGLVDGHRVGVIDVASVEIPFRHEYDLAKITLEGVRSWFGKMHKTTPSRAAKAYRVLRAILNTATDDGLIGRNPCRIVGPGQERAPERPLPSSEQVVTLIAAAPPELRALVVLAATCGLRLGELLALRRRHVDLIHRAVTVESQCFERPDGTVEFGPPKSDAGTRRVAVPRASFL
jgi:integrase